MFNRWYIIAVLVCWAASMGWLVAEKILPTLFEGQRPQYAEVLPDPADPARHVCWEIQYSGDSIGAARTLSVREADGSGRMESTVRFDDLPLDEIMSELLGSVGSLIRPLWNSDGDVCVEMTIDSEMHIGTDGGLTSFTTEVRIADVPNVIRLEGDVVGSTLHVAVFTAENGGQLRVRYRDELELPNNAMVSGALSPQERLTQLHVGQTWTMPVYRPFPPNSPVQMVQAKVERNEVFVWDDRSMRAFQVVYRDDAGSGITVAREPIGKMWVREDGVVLQQEARIANMHFRFVRLPEENCSVSGVGDGRQRKPAVSSSNAPH